MINYFRRDLVKIKLNRLQAFNVMDKLFEDCFKRNTSDEVGFVLGCLVFLHDNDTADPATWSDWNKITHRLRKNSVTFTPEEAFYLMIDFFKEYFSSFPETYLEEVIGEKLFLPDGKTINPILWKRWMEAANEVVKEPAGTRRYLELHKP